MAYFTVSLFTRASLSRCGLEHQPTNPSHARLCFFNLLSHMAYYIDSYLRLPLIGARVGYLEPHLHMTYCCGFQISFRRSSRACLCYRAVSDCPIPLPTGFIPPPTAAVSPLRLTPAFAEYLLSQRLSALVQKPFSTLLWRLSRVRELLF